jgi:undecaprenyl-diphosphatase
VDLFDHYLQIIILGIVEGVTEFLPISSTGHLLIAEHMMGTQMPDVFNVVIQAGAILAVVFIYWGKLMDLFGSLDKAASRNYLLKIGGSFLITAVVAFALTHHFHLKLSETLLPIAWATFIGGLVIFAVEFLAKNLYPHEDVSWFEAILIGLAQVVAGVFPGTSRSGASIMTGLILGMKRPSATEFSFLVGIPTMFAASGFEILKYHKDLTSGGHQLLIDIALGFFVSMVVAFFVVKWLLRFVQSHTFNGFAIYRVILGGILLAGVYSHLIPNIGAEENKPAAATETSAPAPQPAPTPAPPQPPPSPVATNSDGSPAATLTKPDGTQVAVPVNVIDSTNNDAPTTILPAPVPVPQPATPVPNTPAAGTNDAANAVTPAPAATDTNQPAATPLPAAPNVPAH